ncbi:MAG: hypothetical protein COA36_07500 [Desulfotalea sp.]|nr:MAG: hypothetical protein COA36_07500 [Desulfotalea sp.]
MFFQCVDSIYHIINIPRSFNQKKEKNLKFIVYLKFLAASETQEKQTTLLKKDEIAVAPFLYSYGRKRQRHY